MASLCFLLLLANVLTESGLGGALVRKKEATKNDYSTVFVINLLFSFACYIILVLSSGLISSFYEDPLIRNLLIVAGTVLIINAFRLTQNAKLISEMRFKERSIYSFISSLLSSAIGIYLAYIGFGVWSLVIYTNTVSIYQHNIIVDIGRVLFKNILFKRIFQGTVFIWHKHYTSIFIKYRI